jgi:murein L,D-transpeptidase YcbB/YkuD
MMMRRSVSAAALALVLATPAFAQQATTETKSGVPAPSVSAPAPAAPPAAPAVTAPAPEAPAAAAAPSGDGAAPAAAAKPVKKKVVKKAPPAPRERGVVSNDPTPSLSANTAQATMQAAQRYRQIAERGGWPMLPKQRLALGSKGAAVQALRSRLAIEGDLDGDNGSPVFDKDLQAAVKGWQQRQGFAQNGVVAGSTLTALNIPASLRARQLEQSALRLGDVNLNFGQRYVVVNIPSASVEAVENGTVVKRYVAVVGKPENASPMVTTRITNVNINPTWTVPTSIIKNEFIPKMRANPGFANYFAKANIRILDRSGQQVPYSAIDWNTDRAVNYTFRQDSGAGNSLGQIRIDMPNSQSVYMHDTPSKRFFNAQDRFFSHGCVRVQDVNGLAAWLLEGNGGSWDKPAISAAIAVGERKDVRLAKAVPVAWVYMTGYVTDDGKVHFRDDVYSLDSGAGAAQAQARREKRALERQAKAAAAQQQGVETTATVPGQRATVIEAQQEMPPAQPQRGKGWMWW